MTGAKTVLLYSGGMDSFAIDRLEKPNVRLYVDMGTRYSAAELSRLDQNVTVVRLPLGQWERPDGIIPLRNLMLACVAAQYGDDVIIGATAGDRVLDKSDVFAALATHMLSYLWQPQHWTSGQIKRVLVPYKKFKKSEIVAAYLAAGHDPAELAATMSCYEPMFGEPCGRCKPCWRKWVAFEANGIGGLLPSSADHVRLVVLPALLAGEGRGREDDDVLRVMGVAK